MSTGLSIHHACPARGGVDLRASDLDPTGPQQALDAILGANVVANKHLVGLGQIGQPSEAASLLVDPARDRFDGRDQGSSVGLCVLRCESPAAGADHRYRATRRVGIQADLPVHGRSPLCRTGSQLHVIQLAVAKDDVDGQDEEQFGQLEVADTLQMAAGPAGLCGCSYYPQNICNRGRLLTGVEIEITRGLRGGADEPRLIDAVRACRHAEPRGIWPIVEDITECQAIR